MAHCVFLTSAFTNVPGDVFVQLFWRGLCWKAVIADILFISTVLDFCT